MSTEPKTAKPEAPKSEPQFPSFDPLAYWATVQQTFQRATADASGRAQAFADQYAALEAQLVQRAQGAVATWVQLTQDALTYGAQLSAEARKISLDAFRKVSAPVTGA
ncbi:MAG TPA: hypothetical protein VNO30_22615 [Kofleriaceae bacterium]|nr:hypothetical protein [Kofleriaceae bacterium]